MHKNSDKKQTGTEFLRWLSEGLKSKRIDINQPDSRAHAVAGFIFLRVPDIFYLYIRESGAELSRDTIQMEFEKLHIHKVRRESVLLKRNCTTLLAKKARLNL
ncbi:DNA-binding domain-containing protein [Klebsiella pneumoniae subsp. pneumoniae]|nr:DNA-binding domain-containing protein [Klebsiella pneumoniae subsp. pneumoniae]